MSRPTLSMTSQFRGAAARVSARDRRIHAAGLTERGSTNLNEGSLPVVTWTRSQPFEHAPWIRPARTKGTIRFLGPTLDGKPAFLNFKKGQEHQTNFGQSLERVVDITDLRYFEPRTTLGVEGVEWVHQPSCLSEDRLLKDQGEVEAFVRSRYFDECGRLVQNRTGAAEVIPYNYRHRRVEQVSGAQICPVSSSSSHRSFHCRSRIYRFQ